MKISITHELVVFLSVTLLGILQGCLFDVFRVVRKNTSRSFVCVGITDVIYWLSAGSLFAVFMLFLTDGELRGYMYVGMILGLILYFLLFSDLIISFVTNIFIFFLKFFNFFLKILLTPARFLYKMILVPVSLFFGKVGKVYGKKCNIRKSGKKDDKKTK